MINIKSDWTKDKIKVEIDSDSSRDLFDAAKFFLELGKCNQWRIDSCIEDYRDSSKKYMFLKIKEKDKE